MSEPVTVNKQVINALNVLNHGTMDADKVQASGAGKAFQSVAQSAAIAVQDAADSLRNVSTIVNTAAGVALAQYVATLDPLYAEVITESQTMMASAITNFTQIGAAASAIVQGFPYGAIPPPKSGNGP